MLIQSVGKTVQQADKGCHFQTSKPSFVRKTFVNNTLSVMWFSSLPAHSEAISP